MELDHCAGSVAWYDLTVADASAAAAFYAAVLGLHAHPVPMGGYDDFNLAPQPDATPVAGICHARGPNADLPAVWLPYFVVDDLDESVAAGQAGGGRLVSQPAGGGGGRSAVLVDPAGAAFALFERAPAVAGLDLAALTASDPVLLQSVAFAALLVASGGEGELEAQELRTIAGRLRSRFPWSDDDIVTEAIAQALIHLGRVSVEVGSAQVAELRDALDTHSLRLLFDDLAAVARADGSVHRMEATLLRHIADAWDIPYELEDSDTAGPPPHASAPEPGPSSAPGTLARH